MKKFTTELAQEIVTRLMVPEVREALEATEKAGDETGTFEVVISTDNVDRYGEVIKLDAWELEHYLKSPVVLWGHDHKTLPIGMATSVVVKDGKLVATGKFAPHEFAQQIRKLYDLGMLRATSVGFIEKEREGNLITKCELIEFSFVSVPANPYALALALDNQRSVDELVTKGFIFIEKGAVQEEQDAVAARQEKWKNFQAVDDVIWAFMNVYFEPSVPVGDFRKLLDETVELLKKVSAGEKNVKPPSEMRTVRENYEALKTLSKENIQSIVIALEALVKDQEPEGDEEADADTEEEKAFKEFSNKRHILQQAATMIGEVLAEARQHAEAKK